MIAVITDRTPAAENRGLSFYESEGSRYGSIISSDGQVESSSIDAHGGRGGCCGQITNAEIEQIDHLLAKLPSDNGILPPNGRRVLVQVAHTDRFDARVYDLANAPDDLWELFRLAKTGMRSPVLWLEPETKWTARTNSGIVGFAVTSDGRIAISSGTGGPIKIWQTDTQSLLREVALPHNVFVKELTISPDDSTLIGTTWGTIVIYDAKTWQVRKLIMEPFIDNKTLGFFKPHFIDNGKYLILETDEPGLRIYETKTWKNLKGLAEIPNGVIAYYPALSNNRSVYVSTDGQIKLWNNQNGKDLAVLGKSKLEQVAFSPDESKVVVVTSGIDGNGSNTWIKFKIQIWNAKNGEFLSELRPFEQDFCESVDGMAWSPDGKFFIAMTKASWASNRGIDIWDVKSGRHRAELNGCGSNSTSPPFVLRKDKIIGACADNNLIGVWDLTTAISKINKYVDQIADR